MIACANDYRSEPLLPFQIFEENISFYVNDYGNRYLSVFLVHFITDFLSYSLQEKPLIAHFFAYF